MRFAVQIGRTLVFIAACCMMLAGCTVIRGTATGPSGEAWYVQAGYYTAKVKSISYCPPEGAECYEARIVSDEDFEKLTLRSTSGGEK